MSLGSWFRDYVYIPMGGNRVSKMRWVFNILTVWMLTGLWHGASWNFVLWGLLFAVLLLLEKLVFPVGKMPAFLQHRYVLFVVMVSFVLFNASDLTPAGADIAGLFGIGGIPAVTAESIYYLRSYAGIFALSIVGATPAVKNLAGRIPVKYAAVLEPLMLMGLLLLCTGYLVDGSFNPFLYFRF